ncbi:MAG: HNH endonuclease [bacterium]|nr:HNH endonuclease [bacterium]
MTSDDKIELLIKHIKYSPSREWINSYFDLVKRVLDVTGLRNDDPRLVMSLSPNNTGWHFPVTINNRYVVALHKKKVNDQNRLFVGLIFGSPAKEIPKFRDSYDQDLGKWGQFKNLRGEHSKPPFFLRFANFPELLYWLETSDQVYQCWHEALLNEVERAKASPFRKYHKPLMYKMAADVNFRAEILDMAYTESKPGLDLLPEQIDEPNEFYEGASKTICVNAYERNSQARNACIEHYGVKCTVCGITFQKKYGSISKGFIHVHHIKPLGEIGSEYKIDPINDLCPVCPNCHAMLHMRKPPYSINELRAMLQK